MKISEILEKAADALDERGWIQQSYGAIWDSPDCAVCAFGAIRAIASGTGDPYQSSDQAEEVYDYVGTAGLLPEGVNGLVTFNDDVATTKEEVTGLLRSAAAKAKEEDL